MGLAGFGLSTLAPGEAQARGFEHAHDKKNGCPNGFDEQMEAFHEVAALIRSMPKDAGSAAPAAPVASTHDDLEPILQACNEKLIACVVTRQYESSTAKWRLWIPHFTTPECILYAIDDR